MCLSAAGRSGVAARAAGSQVTRHRGVVLVTNVADTGTDLLHNIMAGKTVENETVEGIREIFSLQF